MIFINSYRTDFEKKCNYAKKMINIKLFILSKELSNFCYNLGFKKGVKMNIKRIVSICALSTLSLYASTINIDGSYSKLLGNPFKGILETKTQDISIAQDESKLIFLNIETNRNDFGFRKPEISILNTSCNNVLKSFISENYNITKNAPKKIQCEILPSSSIKIEYSFQDDKTLDMISDITVKLDINIVTTIDTNKDKTIQDTITMNRDLNKNGKMDYGLTIRTVWKPDFRNLEETIQRIIEHSIFEILNKNMNIKGLK